MKIITTIIDTQPNIEDIHVLVTPRQLSATREIHVNEQSLKAIEHHLPKLFHAGVEISVVCGLATISFPYATQAYDVTTRNQKNRLWRYETTYQMPNGIRLSIRSMYKGDELQHSSMTVTR